MKGTMATIATHPLILIVRAGWSVTHSLTSNNSKISAYTGELRLTSNLESNLRTSFILNSNSNIRIRYFLQFSTTSSIFISLICYHQQPPFFCHLRAQDRQVICSPEHWFISWLIYRFESAPQPIQLIRSKSSISISLILSPQRDYNKRHKCRAYPIYHTKNSRYLFLC